MSFSLIPDYSFNKITDISAEFLAAHNIDFLMLDMDNTISPYRVDEPDNEVRAWAKELKNRGITLFIVSNSKRVGRTEKFAQELSVSYIKHAKKPSPDGAIKAMKLSGKDPKNSALCGDQIFTDVLCGNLAGAVTLLVYPIKFTNFFLRLRYWVEIPFRKMCRNRF